MYVVPIHASQLSPQISTCPYLMLAIVIKPCLLAASHHHFSELGLNLNLYIWHVISWMLLWSRAAPNCRYAVVLLTESSICLLPLFNLKKLDSVEKTLRRFFLPKPLDQHIIFSNNSSIFHHQGVSSILQVIKIKVFLLFWSKLDCCWLWLWSNNIGYGQPRPSLGNNQGTITFDSGQRSWLWSTKESQN